MSDSDSLESESNQPLAKRVKTYYDTLSSDSSRQVNNKKKERQQRYRERNREKLKQREAQRRKCKQYLQSITNPSTSSNKNRIKLNNEEIIAAISQNSSGSEGTQTSSIQINAEVKEIIALQRKRERQQRYREQNREKLKQREAARRQRLQNAAMISELSTSSNIELKKFINEPIIDEISINFRNVAGLKEMQHLFKWLPADESIDLSNFNCIAKFKRQDVKAARVIIYKSKNISHITTFNMGLAIQNATEVQVSQTSIGDVCVSHVKLEDGRELIMIIVYISPNKKTNSIISFLHERLFSYSHSGSMIFNTNKHKVPLILAGNFNINFAKDESTPLITFLREEFHLQINNNSREHTTKYGTTIDAVFIRYLDIVMSNTFVTYFSCLRPIFTLIPPETTSNITIVD